MVTNRNTLLGTDIWLSCCFLFELLIVNSDYKITKNVFGAKLIVLY